MSKGTPSTKFRFSAELLARVDASVVALNKRRKGKELKRAEWIRIAIEERLDKLERGRKGAKSKTPHYYAGPPLAAPAELAGGAAPIDGAG